MAVAVSVAVSRLEGDLSASGRLCRVCVQVEPNLVREIHP